LDAHVGKAVFQNVFLNSVSGKTRILVTHALHFLPQVDYIYTIVDGRIAERGTYTELMESNGEFAKFVIQFGSREEEEGREEGEGKTIEDAKLDEDKKDVSKKKVLAGRALMQAEERNTGAIAWSVYKVYGSAGKGWIFIPLLLLSVALVQGATVMSSYW
jgi:ABC-type multidrug transport system ATPase subunit